MLEDVSKQQLSSLDQLKLVQKCPQCEQDGSHGDVQLLGHIEDGALVHITCKSCSHKIFAVLGVTQAGIGLVGIVTDLSLEDARRLHPHTAFSDDDLLECYELISDARYSFTQILK